MTTEELKTNKLWKEEDDGYFQHIARIIRIEKHKNIFKDYIDEIIYLQKQIEKIKEGITAK